MLKEFKEFASKGSVVDLAVGVILGAAFGKIVSSFVADMLMPLIGMVLGKVDIKGLFFDLSGRGYTTIEEAKAAGAATLNYGLFITAAIDFILIAFALFLFVRTINRIKRLNEAPAPAASPTTKSCPRCCSAIAVKATRCPNCTSDLSS
ncbi:MAG: large conductance mechanosensitive channel protein MscL [Planctomycetes bacterium]|nr:large conductance mechanosensitive channel protein MscL [Planctomycetota bacterium]NUQ33866.1 large conductance mechanosensitive channel protein MscL [Planctomycetaceae bacterium]